MINLAPDLTVFIQIGLFVSLIFILNILIYKPVLKVLDSRGKKISGLEDDAARLNEEVEKKLAGYRERINAAREEGNAKRVILKKEGLDKEVEILEAVQGEAERTLLDAKDKIAKETVVALQGLREMSREMGKNIAEKALGRPL